MMKNISSKSGRKARPFGEKSSLAPCSKASSPFVANSPAAASTGPGHAPVLTHEQIAERARTIWKAKGCILGHDKQNWLEAEAQLKAELEKK